MNIRFPATISRCDGAAVVQVVLDEQCGVALIRYQDGEVRESHLVGPYRALKFASALVSDGWILREG